jgi:hypothetical protein
LLTGFVVLGVLKDELTKQEQDITTQKETHERQINELKVISSLLLILYFLYVLFTTKPGTASGNTSSWTSISGLGVCGSHTKGRMAK